MKKIKLNIGKDALEVMKLNAKESKVARRKFIKKLDKGCPEAWSILKESQHKLNK